MKVCLVAHRALPDGRAGVEVYLQRLGEALAELGHEVLVFAATKDIARADNEVFDETYGGLRVRRVVRNLFHRSFADTYDDPELDDCFERGVLADFGPDLVHLHHLLYLSFGIAVRAKARGVPVLMTLQDYYLECPRFGHLRDFEGQLCERVDDERCARCLTTFAWRTPPGLAPLALAGRLLGRRFLGALSRVWRAHAGARAKPRPGPGDPALIAALRARRAAVLETLVPAVDRFLCPSRFLLERMRAFGLPAERLVVLPVGAPGSPGSVVRAARAPGRPLRIAYLGSVLPHKGVEVLLDAFAALDAERAASRIELAIHGGWASAPAYGAGLRARARALGARMTGAYEPAAIDGLLAETDLLVVPSLWFENRPVTILDAQVRRVPCLVSDLGGMRELVPDPAARFDAGKPAALAAALRRILAEGLEPGPVPPDSAQELRATLEQYEALIR